MSAYDLIKELEVQISEASANFEEIEAQEIEDDYSDAMLSMERTEASGLVDGLSIGLQYAEKIYAELKKWEAYAGALEERVEVCGEGYADLEADYFDPTEKAGE
jgi:hypothetical protein